MKAFGWITLAIVGLWFTSATTGDLPEPPARVRYDSSGVQVRYPPAQTLQQFRENPAFQYDESRAQPVSWWDRFWWWVWQQLFRTIFSPRYSGVRNTLLLTLIVLTLGFALYQVLKSNLRGAFYSSGQRDLQFSETEENIHEMDLDQLIREAAARGQYRLALRYHYLKALRQLAEHRLIQWKPEKTNRDYVREIPQPHLREIFRELTGIFEYIWYGEFPVDKPLFQQAATRFRHFEEHLSPR